MKTQELDDLLTFRKQRSSDAESLMRYELWDEAENVNRDIIKNIPNDLDAYQRLGDVLSRVGRVDESGICYQKRSNIEKLKKEQKKRRFGVSRQVHHRAPPGVKQQRAATPAKAKKES